MATKVKSRSMRRVALAGIVLIGLAGCGDDGGASSSDGGGSGSACAAAFETWSQEQTADPQGTYGPAQVIETLAACESKLDWKISAEEHRSVVFPDIDSIEDVWTRLCMTKGDMPACQE